MPPVGKRSRLPLGALLAQFLRFALVGVSNTLLTLAVYALLVKGIGVWYLLASAIGFAAGAVNGYLLNRRFTFPEHRADVLTPLRWTIVQGCGLGVDEALLYAFVNALHLDKLIAQVVAIGIVVVLTFAANRTWTFRVAVLGEGPV
jgi:putative flippase GtrA